MLMNKFSKKIKYYFPFISALFTVFLFLMMTIGATGETGFDSDVVSVLSIILVIILVIVLIVSYIYSCLYYKLSGYELTDKEVICQKGVLFKKKSIIEYSKIHAVNEKQNIIQRLFNISTLLIDSGSTNTAKEAEIAICEDKEVVQELLKRLRNKDYKVSLKVEENVNVDVNEETNLYQFTSKSKFIYSLLNTLISLVILFILIFSVIVILLLTESSLEAGLTVTESVFILIGIYVLFNVFCLIIQILYSFVALHNFVVKKENDNLIISYGLLTKINNTFKLNRIKGFKIEQGLLKRIFGYATVRLEVVGYEQHTANNNNQKQSFVAGMLIPLCKVGEVKEYIEQINPDYIPVEKQEYNQKVNVYMAMPTAITSVIFGIILAMLLPLFLVLDWEVVLLFVLICIISYVMLEVCYLIDAIFRSKQQSVSIGEENISIYNGGLNHITTVIKKENLIAVEDITTKRRCQKGIYSYKLHYHTNATTNTIKVYHLDESLRNELYSLLKY